MTEQLTLLGQRNTFAPLGRRRFHGDLIVGVERENGSRVHASEHDPRFPNMSDQPTKRIPITLGKVAAGRLIDFYGRSFYDMEEMDYDCTGVTTYLCGAEDDIIRGRDIQGKYHVGEQVHANDLEEAVAYTVSDQRGNNVHTLIGASRPITNISILGRSVEGGGLLVHTANPIIVDVYRGDSVSKVITKDGVPLDAKH